jgi:hypothetical protein
MFHATAPAPRFFFTSANATWRAGTARPGWRVWFDGDVFGYCRFGVPYRGARLPGAHHPCAFFFVLFAVLEVGMAICAVKFILFSICYVKFHFGLAEIARLAGLG